MLANWNETVARSSNVGPQTDLLRGTTPTMPDFNSTRVPVERLLLDPNNYRFHDDQDFVFAAEQRLHERTVQDRTWQRLRDDGLNELKMSLRTNGFMPMEPLVVRKYEHLEDRYLVIEGNRRLAALMWIRNDIDAGVEVSEDVVAMLSGIPVVVVSHEEEDPAFFEALMGVRHISGTKEWGGYQRAKLVVTLRDERNMEAKDIADRVGMTTHEVNRRYRAFKALEQMREHEDFGDYMTPTLYPLFHEAVSLPVVREWLGWQPNAARFANEDELVHFYTLISPAEMDGVRQEPKITRHSEVRELRSILPNEEAKGALLDERTPFVEALAIAKKGEFSRTWTAKVEAAHSALQELGFREFKNLSGEDRERLQKISDLALEIIRSHEQLQSGEGA